MKLVINTESTLVLTLEVNGSESVYQLKDLIYKQQNIPPCEQRLMAGEQKLGCCSSTWAGLGQLTMHMRRRRPMSYTTSALPASPLVYDLFHPQVQLVWTWVLFSTYVV